MTEPTYFVMCLDTRDPRRERTYFAETPVGYDLDECVRDIADGQHRDVRAVHCLYSETFSDASWAVCEKLLKLRQTLSREARDFLDYRGYTIGDAA